MNFAIIALTVVGVIQSAGLWYLVRGLRRLDRLEARVGHLADALSLLTETSESGFRSAAAEIARIAERTNAVAPVASGSTTRRITTAARKGRTASEIAAEERLAEGEVSLRLHLAKSAAARRPRIKTAKETEHVALRG